MLDIKYRFTCGYSDLSEIIKKWQNIMTRIVGCSYNPHKRFISSHLKVLGKNVFLLGDLNAEPTNEV